MKNLKPVRLAVVALMLMTAACSGAKNNSAAGDKGSEVKAGDAAGETTTDSVVDPNAPTDDGAAPGQETPGADGTTASGPGTAAGGSGGGGGGGGTKTGSTPSGGGTATASAPGANLPNLFTDKEDRIGLTDKQITICGHAALALAPAFDTNPEDLNVYWDMVRDRGGIHGRNVQVTYEDDAYASDKAVLAAQACKEKNPFLLLGGIGFDQIPAVRNWAEQNRMLYLHHIATEKGAENKQFSFTSLPSVEKTGTMFGELIKSKYANKQIGIIYRESPNWSPGFEAGKKVLEAAGIKFVALPVSNGQGVYSSQIRELQSRGAEVVWAWENALAALNIIKQAKNQNYHPKWLVFPFNTTTDQLTADEATKPTIEGIATWPAYSQGDYTTGLFGQYADEIKRFEAAYAKYRPRTKPNDILWQVWVANKGIEHIFQLCGRDCTRSRFANILRGGLKVTVHPDCEVDFTRNPHRGGYKVSLFESYVRKDGVPGWKPMALCRESF